MADQPAGEAGAERAAGSDDPVFRLIYSSRSVTPRPEAGSELGRIFSVSRANNGASGISGALLLHGDRFAQVLEGPEAKVRALFDRIKVDPRHDSVEVTTQSSAHDRVFGRWAMAEVQDSGADMPLLGTTNGMAEGAAWKVSPAQESVLTELRQLTRG